MFEAAYTRTLKEGMFPDKVNTARELMKECSVCARNCGVNRLEGETGFCEIGETAVVSSANPHFGEEAPLVGSRGSGTIFFTSCNLKCVFCQNYEISHLMDGREMQSRDLADLMLGLQRIGCHNINFVTPSHVVPQILEAVHEAAQRGLVVPLVYNTGGYDSVETLRILDGIVDIYMPDLKFMDSEICRELMDAPDYPEVVQAAIREMHRQVGVLKTDEHGVATRGLLIRHLVMPNDLAGTRAAMRFLARDISTHTYVNVMSQYRPCGSAHQYVSINRSLTREEYARALETAQEEGITRLDERTGIRLRFL
jgi:putative pyruvate formate lyase activating enzyme